MDKEEFRASVAEATALLKAMQPLLPKHIDKELIDHLEHLQSDPVGLTFLQNSIAPKK